MLPFEMINQIDVPAIDPAPIRAIRFGWRHRSRADNVLHSIFHQSFEQLVHDIIEVDAVQQRDVTPQLLHAATLAITQDKPLSAADQVKAMQRGVNIVGYDPLWRDAAKARFKPRHFELIRQAGFSSVRIVLPVAPFAKTSGDPLPDSWFSTLDGLVHDALAQGLTVILDEHDYGSARARRPTAAPRARLLEAGRPGTSRTRLRTSSSRSSTSQTAS